jgi:hypothetical protein
VVRNSNGRLHFWRAAEREAMAADHYGNSWAWEGDLAVVDGRVHHHLITFPDYPNAFERLAGALDCACSGHLWMTAKIGHEFVVPGVTPYPGGGSHASLHRLDSQPPLFVAGAPPESLVIPDQPRIIDVFGHLPGVSANGRTRLIRSSSYLFYYRPPIPAHIVKRPFLTLAYRAWQKSNP